MEIQYRTSRSDAWRCNLYILAHRPGTWFSLLVPSVLGTWFGYWLSPVLQASLYLNSSHWWLLPTAFLLIFALNAGTTLYGIRERVNKSYPDSETRPVTTTTLTPESLCDCSRKVQGDAIFVVPMQILWTRIVRIQWHNGDLYLQRKGGTNFIPRTAFDNPRESHLFFETAVHYWRSAQAGQPAVGAPSQDGIWPPAPRL